jgi:hypothetical protein
MSVRINETEVDDVPKCSTCDRLPHLSLGSGVKDFFVFCANGACPRGGFREQTLEQAKLKWTEFHAKEGEE